MTPHFGKRMTSLVLGVSLLFGSGMAMAQAKTIIKLGWTSSAGDTDPYAVGAREFKKAVEANSQGRIEVQLFPNRQLGDEKKMAAKLDAKGIKLLGFMEGGFRNMINNVRPVLKPDDVKGVKYRVMQNPVFIGMFSSMGGNAVPMAWGETFTAVQQGTIDGLEIPLAVIDQNKYFEVTKYLSLTNHTYSAIPLLISKRTFDRMPEDLKKAVVDAGVAATKAQRSVSEQVNASLVKSLESKGMKVNRIADAAAFRKSLEGVYDKVRTTTDAEIMQEAMAAVQQRK
ncbi:MAG: TRAP transporter substrate-binding protein [Burkholderiaceae bacterium]|nr:TRAP transporter substrate-binding protein [Burkholderiaceae bacterium]